MGIIEGLTAFLTGGAVYVIIELLWRRRSHISMFFAGGLAFFLIHAIYSRGGVPLPLMCVAGGAIITAVEFAAGYVVNIKLRLAVWDYSARRFNLYGQICLLYSLLWSLITLPAAALSAAISRLMG